MTDNRSEGERMMNPLKKCTKPDCFRQTTAGYCCGGCSRADREKYEIHADGPLGHSAFCDMRHLERGGWGGFNG